MPSPAGSRSGRPAGGTSPGRSRSAVGEPRREDGVAYLRRGLLALSESAVDENGREWLYRALVDLRVGDSAFAGFLELLDDVDTSDLGREFPAVAFVAAEDAVL